MVLLSQAVMVLSCWVPAEASFMRPAQLCSALVVFRSLYGPICPCLMLCGLQRLVESPTSPNFPSKREASTGLSSCGTLASFFFGTRDHVAGTLCALIPG